MSSGNAMLDGILWGGWHWPSRTSPIILPTQRIRRLRHELDQRGAERLSGGAPVVGQRRQSHLHRSVERRPAPPSLSIRCPAPFSATALRSAGMIRPTTPRRPTAITTTTVADGTITIRTAACGSAAMPSGACARARPRARAGASARQWRRLDHLAGRHWPVQLLRHQQPQPGHLHRHVVQSRLGPGAGSIGQRPDHLRVRRRPDGVRHRGDPISLRRQHVVSHGRRHLHAARHQCTRHLLDLHLGCRRHRSDRLWRHP